MALTLLPGVLVRQVGDEAVVLGSGRDAAYWRLNPTARQMLELLLDGREPGTVASVIADAAGAEPTRVEDDVRAFVDSLVCAGLARRVG